MKNLVDNNTYNLIMALGSNLEAYEAYNKYAKDGNEQLWKQLCQQTETAVTLLQEALMSSQGQNGQGTNHSKSNGSAQSGSDKESVGAGSSHNKSNDKK